MPTDHDLPVISDYYSINLNSLNKLMALKVATHMRNSPCDIVLETSPLKSSKRDWWQGLAQEQFTQSVLRNNSHGKPNKNKKWGKNG